ncbi:uncharacterized protein LOC112348681 [Selaginella moellendorffii]|uniref:uncharacterized protein LOC112348681 n=1 Tax=Selaginella moellendorffii TaxID=88036 RepID=UPI000D1C7985|nr:uncharacterized protein LOC112348681 [Selaginella moellendorffii]|eukprot:XP_024537452.1 uncharacterized protein LOC112348681 [Selaginella moellendorffii]
MPGKVVRMAPRQRKRERTPGEALVDRFLALCSSEDRGKLLFKFFQLELADSRKEARIIKRQIIRMVRDKIPKSAHPARHRKNVPKASPEEIMKARTREEAETIENPDYPDCLDDEEDARFDAW